jgi:hypothetical protein
MAKKIREELETMFEKLGIDYSHAGFYDTPAFKAIEKKAPAFIEAYAKYVDSLDFDEGYKQRAQKCAMEAAEFLFKELIEDGRRGACIDASGVLQRILDRQKVWNYLVGGGVRISFPSSSAIRDSYFWPLVHPDNPAKTGHAWLCAPPFKVLDITLPIQPYPPKVAAYFNGFIAMEECSKYEAVAGDLYENELVELVIERTGKPPTLENLAPRQKQFMGTFPSFGVGYAELALKYIPMQISAIDSDLEEMRNLCLSGMYPLELYKKFLRTR